MNDVERFRRRRMESSAIVMEKVQVDIIFLKVKIDFASNHDAQK